MPDGYDYPGSMWGGNGPIAASSLNPQDLSFLQQWMHQPGAPSAISQLIGGSGDEVRRAVSSGGNPHDPYDIAYSRRLNPATYNGSLRSAYDQWAAQQQPRSFNFMGRQMTLNPQSMQYQPGAPQAGPNMPVNNAIPTSPYARAVEKIGTRGIPLGGSSVGKTPAGPPVPVAPPMPGQIGTTGLGGITHVPPNPPPAPGGPPPAPGGVGSVPPGVGNNPPPAPPPHYTTNDLLNAYRNYMQGNGISGPQIVPAVGRSMGSVSGSGLLLGQRAYNGYGGPEMPYGGTPQNPKPIIPGQYYNPTLANSGLGT